MTIVFSTMFDTGVLGGLDRACSARRDHRGGCHPHLSSWISSCCSQRTSVRFDNPQYQKQCIHFPPQSFTSITLNTLKVRNGHRQLHRHLDGVRGVLHQRWLPQPRPRNLPQVRMQGPHPDGGRSFNEHLVITCFFLRKANIVFIHALYSK